MTSERFRLLRRSAGFVAFGIVAYLTALTFCFPYDRAREMAVAIAAKNGFDVDIASARPSFPFGVVFEDIRARSRASAAGTKPLQARFESARVALLPLLFSNGHAFDVVLTGLGGGIEISGRSQKKAPFHFELRAHDINMAQLPGARELFNLPLAGTLAVTAELDSATGNFADTRGELGLTCSGCVIGDGKTPIKIGGSNPFLAAGLTLPRIRLGDVSGRATVEKGLARFQGVEAKSPDAELTLEGEVTLRDPPAYSVVNAYLRFKLGDGLLKASPAIASVLQMAAAPGRRPDGFYGLRLGGTFSAMTSAFAIASPLVGGGSATGRGGGRPAIMPTMKPNSSGRPSPFPTGAAPPQPSSAPAAESPPPPPEPVAAPPPMRGTPAAGGIVESTRGMLRGLAGTAGSPTAGNAPPPAEGAAAPPPPPPPTPEPAPEEQPAQ